MRLKKLKISGFKSFADRITIDFDHELIAIVGPNGCGKSNIVDAFRWVLGEQSAKSLRGDKMHDVLFAGSASRKPLNIAEVSVTLTDVKDALNTPYDEVVITRRLHRSGESEYLINRQPVRLRDIHSLLLGSGLGKTAFSVFEQGKLDQVINLNPLQRREIFDEAAGTSRFLQRKKETVRKLAQVTENYHRVKDVHTEVESRTRQLKRQATQAKNFQQNQQELHALEQGVLVTKWHQIAQKHEEADTKLHHLSETVKEKHTTIRGLEEHLEKKREALAARETELREEQKRLYQAQTTVQITESEIKQLTGRFHEMGREANRLYEELEQLKEADGEREHALTDKTQQFAKLHKEKEHSEKELKLSEERLRTRKEELKERQKEHLAALQKEGLLRGELQQKTVRLETLTEALDEKKRQITKLEGVISRQEGVVKKLSKAIEHAQGQQKAVEKRVAAIQQKLTAVNETITESLAREKVLKEQFEKVSEGAKRLLQESRDRESPLFDKLQALFAFQHHPQTRLYADTLVVKTREDLEKILTFAKKRKLTDFSLLCLEGAGEKRLEGYWIDFHGDARGEPIKGEPIEALQEEQKKLRREEKHLLEERRLLQEEMRKEEMRLVQENFALQRARSDVKETQEEHKTLRERLGKQESLAELKKAHRGAEGAVAKISRTLAKEEKEYESFEAKQREAQRKAQESLSRWQLLSQEIKLAETRIAHAQQQQKKLESARTNLLKSREKTQSLLSEKEKGVKEQQKELATLQKMAYRWDEELASFRRERETIEQQLSEERRQLGESEKERHHLEVLLAEDTAARKGLEEELSERHQIMQEQIKEIEISLGMEIKEAEGKIRALRVAVDRAGAINMTAIEEYQEYEERYHFLEKQLHDLEASKQDLEAVIVQLDKECRKRFKETFEEIRSYFQKNFAILFNGGEADLKFTESPDILEAGVEIIAKPPGKQMRAISLLSGGEKCLTALALLFALFEKRPAPFCILDEVDAPLDDTNVDRFTNVLRQFTNQTQFLIVTHNKKTMAIADLLLGVSMEEKGVSKLISLAFETQEASLLGV